MQQLTAMTNDDLRAEDAEVESWQDVEDLRESLAMLYICLDKGVVDPMLYQDLAV